MSRENRHKRTKIQWSYWIEILQIIFWESRKFVIIKTPKIWIKVMGVGTIRKLTNIKTQRDFTISIQILPRFQTKIKNQRVVKQGCKWRITIVFPMAPLITSTLVNINSSKIHNKKQFRQNPMFSIQDHLTEIIHLRSHFQKWVVRSISQGRV